ncbi:CHAT domain-containing protein [Cadophora sp. MPI-SDFR-AT-0126]|nr:CHAT domain-containing protein [Leotiomycetes sp. MPI-SDFR-AT-0126]
MNARARGNANKALNPVAGRGRGRAQRNDQSSLDFPVDPVRNPLPSIGTTSRETSLKRPRASTANTTPTLPPHRRRPPKIETTKAYMFKGLHPLYTRHNITDPERWHKYIEIRCDDPHRPMILNNLAAVLQHKLARQGSEDEISVAISLVQEGLDHPALVTFDRPMLLSNMSHFIGRRYEHSNNRDDLRVDLILVAFSQVLHRTSCTSTSAHLKLIEKACDLAEEAVNVTSSSERQLRAQYSHNAGLYFGLKAQGEHGTLEDIENAVRYSESAVSAILKQHYLYRKYLHALGIHLGLLSARMNSLPILERAIQTVQEAVDMVQDNKKDKAEHCDSLARLVHRKFEMTKSSEDLYRARELGTYAVEMTPNPASISCLSNYWEDSYSLSNSFLRKYTVTKAHEDLRSAIDVYTRGANAEFSPPKSLILAARNAARLQLEAGDLEEAFVTLEKAVHLLPKLNPRHFRSQDKIHATSNSHVTNLASDTAALGLATGKSPMVALQILESGNAVILASVVDCRNDVTGLRERDEGLCDEFETLRKELDASPNTLLQLNPVINSHDMESKARRRRRFVAQQLDLVIAKIRDLEGFHDFLLPPSEETLKALSACGPIIVLNQSFLVARCDVIVVTPGDVTSLHLDFMKYDKIQITGETEQFNLEKDVYVGGLRTFGRRNNQLSWPFNVMPIHAAGQNSPGCLENSYSLFISSYVPSLKTLRYVRERNFTLLDAEKPSLLVATMADTPGATSLKGVVLEASSIVSLASDKLDVRHLAEPTANDVVEAMTSSNAAHFSCHGSTVVHNPSLSALIFKKNSDLNNGTSCHIQDPLTVGAISILNAAIPGNSNMQLAFLSACSSASVDNQSLGNEALHIAGGFLLAGFVHVVATLWLVRDDVCVEISTRFWTELLGNFGVQESTVQRNERVRRTLHLAVRSVKEKHWDQPQLWAP